MGDYSVPEHIRAMKPQGKHVKKIGNGYYVYECRNVKGEDGKWRLRTGRAIGCIKEGVGFIPNDNYNGSQGLSVCEYGQYALVESASKGELALLREHFNPLEATVLYLHALVMVVNGYQPMKDIGEIFSLSHLSVRYPTISMSYYTLSKLLESIGRHEANAIGYEARLLSAAKAIAIDGHCFESYSGNDDLAEYGNKYRATGQAQVNLLMAYDVDMKTPAYSKMFPGGMLDKTSIKHLLADFDLSDKVFLVDRGFYSEENLSVMTERGNNYVIPLSENLKEYKEIKDSLDYRNSFIYRANHKMHPIYFREAGGKGGGRVILYKDMNRSVTEEDCFRRKIGTSKDYTQERFEALKPYFGTFVLKTSLEGKTSQEIFEFYKKRWCIETHYNLLKNRDGIAALGLSDYYVMQGLSLVILIAGRIESSFREKCRALDMGSPDDILLQARKVKIRKGKNGWEASNTSKKLSDLFSFFSCPLIGDLGLVT